jgi:hypothetical protein
VVAKIIISVGEDCMWDLGEGVLSRKDGNRLTGGSGAPPALGILFEPCGTVRDDIGAGYLLKIADG